MKWQEIWNRGRVSMAYRMKQLTQQLPIIPISEQSQPFIVLGHPRSGSTLLHTLLNSHPNIYSRGEWLGMDFTNRMHIKGWSAEEFIQKGLLPMRWPVKAVGFKVFYEYSHSPEGTTALEILSQWPPNLKVIFLTRENQFEQYLSLRIAEKTRQWSATHVGEKLLPADKRIKIDIQDYRQHLSYLVKLEGRFAPQFHHYDSINVSYEQLVEDRENTLLRICGFLKVAHWPMVSPLIRQNPEPWQELVINADEVAKELGL